MARDILDHHDGVVDDESDGDRQTAKRHQVECFSAPVKEQKCDCQGCGYGQCRDEHRPPASEKGEEDQDTEETANHNRIAYVVNRGRDKTRLIVDDNRLDVSWWTFPLSTYW